MLARTSFKQSVEKQPPKIKARAMTKYAMNTVQGVVAFVKAAVLDERFEEHGLGVSSTGLELLPRVS
jgi:hypothetical protein